MADRSLLTLFCTTLLGIVCCACPPSGSALDLGITSDGQYFTVNKKPVFLLGVSYYGGLSVQDPGALRTDLDDILRAGFNWIRVWATWNPEENVSAVNPDGTVREPYMSRLKSLIRECDSRGIIVDVTVSRGNHPFPSNQSEHISCMRTLARELRPFRNLYFDVSNERDVGDARYVSLSEVRQLVLAVKNIDPKRLCTASGRPGSPKDLAEYVKVARCDFIAPHLERVRDAPSRTEQVVAEFIDWMKTLGIRVPIHLQEPFRRDYNEFQPDAEDFYADARAAKKAGAAGWCFHNGSNRHKKDGRPHRSFLMSESEGRLLKQLDPVELEVFWHLKERVGGTELIVK